MTEKITRQQFQALQAKPKKNKYGAKRVELDGHKFASMAERDYYALLKIRERAGEVCDVKMQQSYALVVNGLLVATYRDDFSFFDNLDRRRHVVDTKGMETPVFKIKKKLMLACHGIEIEVVK